MNGEQGSPEQGHPAHQHTHEISPFVCDTCLEYTGPDLDKEVERDCGD